MMLASPSRTWQDGASYSFSGNNSGARSCSSAAALEHMTSQQPSTRTLTDLQEQAPAGSTPNNSTSSALDACEVEVSLRPSFLWRDASLEPAWTDQECAALQAETSGMQCQIEGFACAVQGRPQTHILGIFEGSGAQGQEAAVAAAALAKRQLAASCQHSHKLQDALRSLCTSIHAELQQRRSTDGLDLQLSGITAAFAVVQRGKVTWCCVGNSAAAIGQRTKGELACLELPCSPSLTMPQEVARVQGWGGSIVKGPNPQAPLLSGLKLSEAGIAGLALSRAFGHRAAAFAGLSNEPTLHTQQIKDHEAASFVVAGSGALWQVMSPPAALQFVERYTACPWDGVSPSAALTLEAQQRWKAAHPAVVVPALAAIVLPLPSSYEHSSPQQQNGCHSRPTPPNYPPCASDNAAANNADVLSAAQNGLAPLSPTFFEIVEDQSDDQQPPPQKPRTKSPARPAAHEPAEKQPSIGARKPSADRVWRAFAGATVVPLLAHASCNATQSPPRPVTPPASAFNSPTRNAKKFPYLAPLEAAKLKPPLRATSNLQAARTASGHLENLLAGLTRQSATDLCLPRYSIPESQPLSVPRVRSTGAIASLLLPVRKAYPSQEGLTLTSSTESEREKAVPEHLLTEQAAASLESISTLQETPPDFAATLSAALEEEVKPMQRSNGLSLRQCSSASRGKSLSVGASPVKENSRVHGGSSPVAGVPSFAAYLALARESENPDQMKCNAAEWFDLPVHHSAPQQHEEQQQQQPHSNAWPSSENTGKQVHTSLLRRSLSHLSHVPPSPFLSQCLRPLSTSRKGSAAGSWTEDEEYSDVGGKALSPRSMSLLEGLNPWSEPEDPSGRDNLSSRDGSFSSSVVSLNRSSSKLRGGSSALRILQSNSSLQGANSSDPATSEGFPASSWDRSLLESSSHAGRPSFEQPSEASCKQRGSSLALDALQSSSVSLSPPSPHTPSE